MKEGKITIAELGPRLKLVRQELGITQRELAQALDMNQAILSKFENGGMVYASVLLDVLNHFRGTLNLNYLLTPGDKYDLSAERARFSDDQQRDYIINNRREYYLQQVKNVMADATQKCEDAINSFAEFCNSEPSD